MESNVDRLGRRMVELNNALQDKRTNPDYGFENVKSVDMLIKFVITLDGSENGINDGIYIYMNDDGSIVNFYKHFFFITIFIVSITHYNIY